MREFGDMTDLWSRWLGGGREGGDSAVRARALEQLGRVRETVLGSAALKPGDTVLDVGCGDGLIAFGALDEVGPDGRVLFADISQPLLDSARALAEDGGVADRCSFLECSADALSAIGDQTVDVVTTRSVLIYVADKARAFAEFARVLRPGGRISLWEPINRLDSPEPPDRWFWYDVREVQPLADRIKAASTAFFEQEQFRPMMNFDDRDLFAMAEHAGFLPLHLALHRDVEIEHAPQSWESFAASSPNPLAPTVGELIERTLARDEASRFVACLRPQVEVGRRVRRLSIARLWGERATSIGPGGRG